MITEFNNPIARDLQEREQINLLYAIICEDTGARVLAIKDDGGDNDGYLHLHNSTPREDNEDLELYENLIDR